MDTRIRMDADDSECEESSSCTLERGQSNAQKETLDY